MSLFQINILYFIIIFIIFNIILLIINLIPSLINDASHDDFGRRPICYYRYKLTDIIFLILLILLHIGFIYINNKN